MRLCAQPRCNEKKDPNRSKVRNRPLSSSMLERADENQRSHKTSSALGFHKPSALIISTTSKDFETDKEIQKLNDKKAELRVRPDGGTTARSLGSHGSLVKPCCGSHRSHHLLQLALMAYAATHTATDPAPSHLLKTLAIPRHSSKHLEAIGLVVAAKLLQLPAQRGWSSRSDCFQHLVPGRMWKAHCLQPGNSHTLPQLCRLGDWDIVEYQVGCRQT